MAANTQGYSWFLPKCSLEVYRKSHVSARVDFSGVHLTVQHEIGLVEDVTHQDPSPFLVWIRDRLTHHAEGHQTDQQHDSKLDITFDREPETIT